MKSGKWRHSKSGKEYSVIGIGKHSETLNEMIIYQAEYGEKSIWIRPADMWSELVEVDGLKVPRFVRIE